MGKDRTLEIIKTEIKRRIKELDEQIVDIYDSKAVLRKDELQRHLSFLSTPESEKPMSLEEEISRTYHDGSVTDTSDLDHNSYENIARHFAQWGAEHLKK